MCQSHTGRLTGFWFLLNRLKGWILMNEYDISSLRVNYLTLILLTWRKWWAPNNASKQQMGFNSAFKGLMSPTEEINGYTTEKVILCKMTSIRTGTSSSISYGSSEASVLWFFNPWQVWAFSFPCPSALPRSLADRNKMPSFLIDGTYIKW